MLKYLPLTSIKSENLIDIFAKLKVKKFLRQIKNTCGRRKNNACSFHAIQCTWCDLRLLHFLRINYGIIISGLINVACFFTEFDFDSDLPYKLCLFGHFPPFPEHPFNSSLVLNAS